MATFEAHKTIATVQLSMETNTCNIENNSHTSVQHATAGNGDSLSLPTTAKLDTMCVCVWTQYSHIQHKCVVK